MGFLSFVQEPKSVSQVTLTGGAEHPAKIVGFDEDRDVAVLQLITNEGDPVSPCCPHYRFYFMTLDCTSAVPEMKLCFAVF